MFSVRIGIDLDGVVFNSENYIASFIELTYMDKIVDGELNFKSSSTKKRYNIPDADFDTGGAVADRVQRAAGRKGTQQHADGQYRRSVGQE